MYLPQNNHLEHDISPGYHLIQVHDKAGDPIGHIQWLTKTGEIHSIRVASAYQRRGIATAMYHMANQLSDEYGVVKPKHSNDRSDQGDKWAKSVGGDLPERVKYV